MPLLSTGYRPLASPPRSGLERSDFVLWRFSNARQREQIDRSATLNRPLGGRRRTNVIDQTRQLVKRTR
jgi:hypothetical protein